MTTRDLPALILSLTLAGLLACGSGGSSSIRQPATLAISPAAAVVEPGKTVALTAQVSGAATLQVVWSVDAIAGGNPTVGTVAAAGLRATYTAPAQSGAHTVTAAGASDTSIKATASVTVQAPVLVNVAPPSASISTSSTVSITASVTGSSDTAVTWAVDGVAGGNAATGTVTGTESTVTYLAPAAAGSHTITATSAADTSKSASVQVTVLAPAGVAVALSPSGSATVASAGTLSITATVTGSTNTAVLWTVDGVAGGSTAVGTVSGTGTYTAPAAAGTHLVTATSVADPGRSASIQVTVLAPAVVAVSLAPSGTASVASAGTLPITATVTGSSNTAVTWTVDGLTGGSSTAGTVAGTGATVVYSAPAAAGTHTVRATSAADTARSAAVTITVQAPAPVAVALTPSGTAAVTTSGTLSISASVTGTSNTAVAWTVDGAPGGGTGTGTLTGSGATVVYTAPEAAGTHTVTATSAADGTKSAILTITVQAAPPVAVTLTPAATASVLASGTLSVTASVTGSSNTAVTWTVDGAAGGNASTGTLAGTGATVAYTAPAAAGTHTVTATSAADTSKQASLSITVQPQGAVTVSLARVGPATINTNGSTLITASVPGSSNAAVTWSVDGVANGGAATGTILAPGSGTTAIYTAPASSGTHTVTATSVADPGQSASTTFTVAGTILQASSIPVGANVRNAPYNATGNGITDDTAAIMAAVRAVTGTGRAVYVPAGTYMINATANSGAGIRLGSNMTLLLDPGAVLQALPTSTVAYEVVCVSGIHDVNITGGTIRGNNGNNTIPTPTQSEGGDALAINNSRNVVVEGVVLQDGFADGLYIASTSSNITVSGVTARANRRNGMSIVNASDINVTSSDFSGNLGSVEVAGASMVNGSGIDIEANANQHIDNVLVAGCTFTGNRYIGLAWGILYSTAPGSSTDNIFVVGNTATGNDRGLDVENCAGSFILNNRVSSSGSVGIFIHDGASGTVCRGNTVNGTGAGGDGSGIECYLDTGSVVDGNTSTGNRRYGILAANSTSPTITNNTCPGNTLGGVYTYQCTGVTASGNAP